MERDSDRERKMKGGRERVESRGNRMMTHKFPILWACQMLLLLMAV